MKIIKLFFGSHFLEKTSKSGDSGTIGFFIVWNFSLHLFKPGHYFWISGPIKMFRGQASPKILKCLKIIVGNLLSIDCNMIQPHISKYTIRYFKRKEFFSLKLTFSCCALEQFQQFQNLRNSSNKTNVCNRHVVGSSNISSWFDHFSDPSHNFGHLVIFVLSGCFFGKHLRILKYILQLASYKQISI